MHLVVGLGNPGRKYDKTRHNMGFNAIDKMADDLGIKVKTKKFRALVGEGTLNGEKIILVKPQTYMNNSGESVGEIFSYYKIPDENLIVIYDDVDLPAGSVRVRKSGGPGTHNGMKSVIHHLGFTDFPRVRLGIGTNAEGEDLIDHVIGKVPRNERRMLDDLALKGADAVKDIVTDGVEIAMTRHNNRGDRTGDDK